MVLWKLTKPSRINSKKDVLFIIGTWNAKVGSQEIPGITGKFGLGVQDEAGQRLKGFCEENALVIANSLFQQHKRRLYTLHHQMVNTKIRLIIFFAAEDGEALYSQQKQTGTWMGLRFWTPYCKIPSSVKMILKNQDSFLKVCHSFVHLLCG